MQLFGVFQHWHVLLKLILTLISFFQLFFFSQSRLMWSLWGCDKIQWKLVNEITLGPRETYRIIQMITISYSTLHLFSFKKCPIDHIHYTWFFKAVCNMSLAPQACASMLIVSNLGPAYFVHINWIITITGYF